MNLAVLRPGSKTTEPRAERCFGGKNRILWPHMKFLVHYLGIAFLLTSSATLAHADDASKQAKIDEMLTLTHADRMIQQVFAQMQPMMAAQVKKMDLPADATAAAQEMQQKLMDWLSSQLTWDKLKPAYEKIYGEVYTEDEITGIVNFYKSPAGQAMVSKTPELMQKSIGLMQELMGDLAPQIQKITEELAQKYKKQ